PVTSWDLDDLGLDAGQVGSTGAWTAVDDAVARPPRTAGTIIKDEGEGGRHIADYLATHKFI
ncbi:electron transfer flavoprotein subunit beta, partial [Streptomyces sp. CWNU-1]|nr:electron transfer flavoprotein subunit beta [Streptomyces sp. CWNU-1]